MLGRMGYSYHSQLDIGSGVMEELSIISHTMRESQLHTGTTIFNCDWKLSVRIHLEPIGDAVTNAIVNLL